MTTRNLGRIHHPSPLDRYYLHPDLFVAQGVATATRVYLKVIRISQFQITDGSLAALQVEGVSAAVRDKLVRLRNILFGSRLAFLKALSDTLTADELQQYQALVLGAASIPDETEAIITGPPQPPTATSAILRHPDEEAKECGYPCWAAVVTGLSGDKEYAIELLEEGTDELLDSTVLLFPPGARLDEFAAARLKAAKAGHNTYITSPSSNAVVCSTCWASGGTNSSGAVTGQLTATAGPGGNITGTQGSLSNGIWSLKFTGLDTSTTYTLNVSVGSDPATPASTGLTARTCTGGGN